MFANLKIIINKNMDLDYIQNYPVLCYFIYNISCMLTKYKKWYVKIDEPVKDTDKTIETTKPKIKVQKFISLIINKEKCYPKSAPNYHFSDRSRFVRSSQWSRYATL